MGRHIRARGDQGRLAWNWEVWAKFGEVLGDLEKGYQRWGREWDMLRRLASYSPNWFSCLSRHMNYIS